MYVYTYVSYYLIISLSYSIVLLYAHLRARRRHHAAEGQHVSQQGPLNTHMCVYIYLSLSLYIYIYVYDQHITHYI